MILLLFRVDNGRCLGCIMILLMFRVDNDFVDVYGGYVALPQVDDDLRYRLLSLSRRPGVRKTWIGSLV